MHPANVLACRGAVCPTSLRGSMPASDPRLPARRSTRRRLVAAAASDVPAATGWGVWGNVLTWPLPRAKPAPRVADVQEQLPPYSVTYVTADARRALFAQAAEQARGWRPCPALQVPHDAPSSLYNVASLDMPIRTPVRALRQCNDVTQEQGRKALSASPA